MKREVRAASAIESFAGQDCYPEEVYLPAEVHERTIEAVELTAYDFRERSIHFRHNPNKQRWIGGAAVQGTAYNGISARSSLLHGLLSAVVKPDISFHTHPHPNEQHADQAVKGFRGEEAKRSEKEKFRMEMGSTYMLPSGDDVEISLYNITGSAAHLLSSEGGNFMAIKRKEAAPDIKLLSNPFNKDLRALGLDIKKIADEYEDKMKKEIPYISPNPRLVKAKLLSHTATVLSSKYDCYFTDDFRSPVLRRVAEDEYDRVIAYQKGFFDQYRLPAML